MMQLDIKVTGDKALIRQLRKFGVEGEKTAGRVTMKVAQGMSNLAKKELRKKKRTPPRSAIFQGFLVRSISAIPGAKWLSAKVGTSANYAANVEYGQQPGAHVSANRLINWVRKRLMSVVGLGKGASGVVNQEKKAKSLAYAVARSISKKGTKEHPFMRPAAEKWLKHYVPMLTKALNSLIAKQR